MYKISELEMCNQVRGFRHGVRKFIVKIQMTFPSSADISLCLHNCIHTCFQAKLNSESSNILSDGSLIDMLRPESKLLNYFYLYWIAPQLVLNINCSL